MFDPKRCSRNILVFGQNLFSRAGSCMNRLVNPLIAAIVPFEAKVFTPFFCLMVAILARGDANGEDFIQSGRCVCKRVGARCHRFSFKFGVEVCHRRTLCDKSTRAWLRLEAHV